ncbi:MAG TPA: ROK family protein, partial [Candidatus Dormibacteraeota bacterium]|nr:ROK family protein [Candidatus Dormibacteraeota bacterium]
MSLHLGLDLGGTNLKWAAVERGSESRIAKSGRVPTDTSAGERSVVRQLIDVAREVMRDEQVDSVGVGMPGYLDPDAGITHLIPNIPGNWDGVPVIAQMTEALAMPVGLINDARA